MLSFLFSRPLLALRQDREGEDCQRKGRKSGRECPGPEQNRFSEIPHFLISGSARENNCGKQSPEPMARLSLTHPTGLCLPADVIKHVHSSRDPKLTNFIHQPSTKIELNQSQGYSSHSPQNQLLVMPLACWCIQEGDWRCILIASPKRCLSAIFMEQNLFRGVYLYPWPKKALQPHKSKCPCLRKTFETDIVLALRNKTHVLTQASPG